AFFFTYLLYAGGSHQNQKENFILNMVFLCIFFLIHSALAYYYKILKKEKSTTLEIIHLISNAFLFFILAYSHINHLYGSKYPSIVSNILGIYYIAHVYFFYKKNIEDKALSLSLLGLAVFFTGLTLPLFLEERALTFAWALFSAILLWLGKKLGSSFLSTLSYISYTILGFRTFFLDLPASFDTLPGNYWQGFIGRMLGTGSSILSYFLGLYLEHKQYGETIFDNKNDLHTLKKLEGRGKPILFWMGIIAFFLFLNAEFDAFFINSSVKELFITSTWCIFGFLIYFYFTATKNPLFSAIGILLLILVLFRFTVLFFSVWFGEGMGMYKGEYTFFEFILRWFTFFVIAFSIFNFRRFTSSDSKVRPSYFAVIGLLFLFQFLSLEVRQFFEHFMPRLQKGAVSVLWSVYAISCITYGIQKKEKALRYTGLALFLVVVLKVFFVDLARMDAIVRIFAFLILGGLLIFGSFLYIRSEKE
ncbi:MAG: DUF2339 domain-containing protein, partial [Leptospiraceae bacterium]|nr:DUF2339 domain-containing protein [Leptospiraceae bacterium]